MTADSTDHTVLCNSPPAPILVVGMTPTCWVAYTHKDRNSNIVGFLYRKAKLFLMQNLCIVNACAAPFSSVHVLHFIPFFYIGNILDPGLTGVLQTYNNTTAGSAKTNQIIELITLVSQSPKTNSSTG